MYEDSSPAESHQFEVGQIVLHKILQLRFCLDSQLAGGRVVHFAPVAAARPMGFQQEFLNMFLCQAATTIEEERWGLALRAGRFTANNYISCGSY